MSENKKELIDVIVELAKNDPLFVQALKDFESLGFLKILDNSIQIIDRDGLLKYVNDFGKHEVLNNENGKNVH